MPDWRGQEVTVVTRDEVMAMNIAHIMGPASAAAAALREAYARRIGHTDARTTKIYLRDKVVPVVYGPTMKRSA